MSCSSCKFQRWLVVLALSLGSARAHAGDKPPLAPHPECDDVPVIAHVQEQFTIYGPQSQKREYFGFIYRVDGELASAVVRSSECGAAARCIINTAPAARSVPRGAKVLGEWHTHPHWSGSRALSMMDVKGARQNVHIRCYSAFYSGPTGAIYRWDPASTSVPVAMATRTFVGNYGLTEESGPAAYLAAEGNPPTP